MGRYPQNIGFSQLKARKAGTKMASTNIVVKGSKVANKAASVEMVNGMVAKATMFTTIEQAAETLKRFTSTDNANRYIIGSIFNAVKEKKLVDNVAQWAENFGYAPNTVYQLGAIAKNFSFEEMEKWGMGKLIEMRTPKMLALLESKGVTPNSTSKEIREKVEEEKETKHTLTKPRKVSLKQAIKKQISTIDKINKAMGDGKSGKEVLGIDDEKENELWDKFHIMLCERESKLVALLNDIQKEEEEKAKAKANKKVSK